MTILRRILLISLLEDRHQWSLPTYSPTHAKLCMTEVYAALADGTVSVEFPDDPKSWKEAMASDEREQWIGGATEELKSLKDLNVYKLVPRDTVPRGRKILKGRLLCTRKRDEAGVVKRHKVRFVYCPNGVFSCTATDRRCA
ncbi:hypothetical protein DENSPDRAFT_844456 [Dentipellis sp. KUC8613]|nr:hypothetical protein DENSPDRAFT_844456 [Dentipellis sp. KUC8613]